MAARRRRPASRSRATSASRAQPLVYVASNATGGLRRVGRPPRARYVDASGRVVRDQATLARIQALAIPPAWTDAWICADPRGHLQATGRDAAGRKQYRYHADWVRARSQDKYQRLADFGAALPRVRRRVRKDLARPGLPRERVLALVVRLLEVTRARIGNDQYAKLHDSRGLTTLLDRHARDARARIVLAFRGKSGVRHALEVADDRLVRLIRKCRDLPGQELFQHVDAGGRARDVTSSQVNDYIRRSSGGDFTAKDFRTWSGTCLALDLLLDERTPGSARAAARLAGQVTRDVAAELGNRPATCRKHYIHPLVFEAHATGTLARVAARTTKGRRLRRVEAILLALLAHGDASRGRSRSAS